MNKKFNFRYYFLLLIFLIIMTIVMVYFSCNGYFAISFTCFAISFTLAFIIFTIIKRKVLSIYMILISISVCVCIVLLSVCVKCYSINHYNKFGGNEYTVCGRICDTATETKSGSIAVILDNVKIDSEEISLASSDKIMLYIKPGNISFNDLQTGTIVKVKSKISLYEFLPENMNSISKGIIGHTFAVSNDVILTDERNEKLDEKVRGFVYEKLSSWNLKYGDIAFAMMFGDSKLIDADYKAIFTESGTAHILAVSGLHISVIIAIILFIFKKLKMPRKIQLPIFIVIALFYCYLCNFSVSIFRASTMSGLALIATIRGKPYDRLSTLSLTASATLIFNPLLLFSYSFILSYTCVFAISLFYAFFRYYFRKVFYNKYADALSICLSIQIGIFAPQLFLFSKFNFISFFANLIIVPLASITFQLIIYLTLFALILPFLYKITLIYDFLIGILLKLGNIFKNISLSISFNGLSVFALLICFAILICLSDLFFEKKMKKLWISLALFASAIIMIIVI